MADKETAREKGSLSLAFSAVKHPLAADFAAESDPKSAEAKIISDQNIMWQIASGNLQLAALMGNSKSGAIAQKILELKKEEDEKKRRRDDSLIRMTMEEMLRRIDANIAKLREQAEWYREQVAKLQKQMDDIAERMGKRSDYIKRGYELLDQKEKTGRLDREKALLFLKEKGITVDENASEEKLAALITEQIKREAEANAKDSALQQPIQEQKEQYEREKQKRLDKADEYEREREKALQNPDREERERQVEKLDKEIDAEVLNSAARRQEDEEKQRKLFEMQAAVDIAKTRTAESKNEDEDFLKATGPFNTASRGETASEPPDLDMDEKSPPLKTNAPLPIG